MRQKRVADRIMARLIKYYYRLVKGKKKISAEYILQLKEQERTVSEIAERIGVKNFDRISVNSLDQLRIGRNSYFGPHVWLWCHSGGEK